MLPRNIKAAHRCFSNKASSIEISKLNNGLRIVTDSTPGHFSALGAYVNAGSRFETDSISGLSHMIDVMAWKSTSKRTGNQMMDDLARLGGNYMSGAQRESILYQSSVFNKDTEKMFECISETIREPKFTDSEFEEAKLTGMYELEELSHKHDMLLPEVLHEAAYSKKTLGMPIYGTHGSLSSLTADDAKKYHQNFFTPDNSVLALVGVDHLKAVHMAEKYLGDWKSCDLGQAIEKSPAKYEGGEVSLPSQEPRFSNLPKLVHMQIAFETGGLLSNDLYALATLQKLLGGGSSFSAGGPGKGMFSRLFRVLNQYPFVENCMAFNHAHTDSGLFGITISCYAEHAEYMAQVACHELAKIMEPTSSEGGIKKQEFDRAKNQLVSSLLMNVESKLAALEDIGRQVQFQGKVTQVEEMVTRIENLSIADVREVAQKVLQGRGNGAEPTRPTVVMQGDRASIGDVEFVLRYFGLGYFSSPDPPSPRDYYNL
ncbi:hypothetical protein OXX79_002356 [Metschnikowia pulcherrima]